MSAGLLDEVLGLYPRAAAMTPTQRAMFFRAVAAHPLDAVRAALDGHVRDPQRGRFAPLPADILAQLEGAAKDDGRPGAEEAWALALRGADEAATIVWTDEAAQAWGIAHPVLHAGDKVGARMAFREAYERLVAEARAERRPVSWAPSLGHDPAARDEAIRGAVKVGLLRAGDYPQLAAPPAVPLLGMDRGAHPLAVVRERLTAARADVDPLAWARELRQREAEGLVLTEMQRTTWRAVLGGAPTTSSTPPGPVFTPPPANALPPGMRPKPDAEGEYEAMGGPLP